MEEFRKLIVLANREPPGNLPLLAQSLGFSVEVVRDDIQAVEKLEDSCLLAIPFSGLRLDKHGLPATVRQAMQLSPIFLYQVESRLVDPRTALMLGIRGLIYRDEQLDQVLLAVKLLMRGQLYFDRALLSAMVDDMLRQRQAQGVEQADMSAMMSLTRQERRIIELVGEGARNKEIAYNLNISAHTVKAHLSSIFRKTQSRNRVELLRWAQQLSRGQKMMA
ncbi:helix-turn-helix transcriptional regulator [Gallaecimonas xiamenensis]|uniref:LuxR family transcriptional regulator n=1 Tax=Gallaecimonas xiamenensis 3-C-1 TaxID=745411 RepID=K2K2C8_9GAMM|nr:response regulator transcription factor [Gallaecimonas xiamenensis]EKE77024.1 LuxR family transcriptional regulator [Gallaecimonas xiamenensis 3-C-1]